MLNSIFKNRLSKTFDWKTRHLSSFSSCFENEVSSNYGDFKKLKKDLLLKEGGRGSGWVGSKKKRKKELHRVISKNKFFFKQFFSFHQITLQKVWKILFFTSDLIW